MPWVSFFDVFPDAVFTDNQGTVCNVENGRVIHDFPDLSWSGNQMLYVRTEMPSIQNHRVRLDQVIAIPFASPDPVQYSNSAELGGTGGDYDYHSDIPEEHHVEFAEIPWDYIEVGLGLNGD